VITLVTLALAVGFILRPGCIQVPPEATSVLGQYVGPPRCRLCHPNIHDNWAETLHAEALETLESISQGDNPDCLGCHTVGFGEEGGFVDRETAAFLAGKTAEESFVDRETAAFLAGKTAEEMNAVTCAICHNPHAKTGNAAAPDTGRDFQLRYPEVANPEQSNSIADATDPNRQNLCGQCHHSRGRTWDATSRGPHHSIQGNVYIGEMPMPDAEAPLVANQRLVHAFVIEQCSTCHMYRKDFESEQAPAGWANTTCDWSCFRKRPSTWRPSRCGRANGSAADSCPACDMS